jgi:hypothetical protein
MNGSVLTGGGFLDPTALPDPGWSLVGTHDFNGDRETDLLWRHGVSGENVLWYMNGRTLVSGTFLTPAALADTRWRVAGTGDFDGDGKPDIVWHHGVSGEVVLWYMDGSRLVGGAFTDPPALADTTWRVVGVADFNDDHRPDLVWRHAQGGLVVWFMANHVLVSGTFTTPPGIAPSFTLAAVGDYDGDRRNDFVFRDAATGQNRLVPVNGTVLQGSLFVPSLSDSGWKIVGPR